MEVICNPICDYSMSCIVPTLGPGAKLHGRAEDIDELAFSLVIEVSIVQLPYNYTERISQDSWTLGQGRENGTSSNSSQRKHDKPHLPIALQ